MLYSVIFFLNDTAPTEIYTYCHTLSLHDALPISLHFRLAVGLLPRSGRPEPQPDRPTAGPEQPACQPARQVHPAEAKLRSEEHTSELQSLMRSSYAVFCLKKKKTTKKQIQ